MLELEEVIEPKKPKIINNVTKEFSRDYLINTLNLPKNAIQDEVFSTGLFTVTHKFVFQDLDKKYYSGYYYLPIGIANGFCENGKNVTDYLWENFENVKCEEVKLKETVTKLWTNIIEGEEDLDDNNCSDSDSKSTESTKFSTDKLDNIYNIIVSDDLINKLEIITQSKINNEDSVLDKNMLLSIAINVLVNNYYDYVIKDGKTDEN